MPSLREVTWSSSPNPNTILDDVLEAAIPTGSVTGIAYTAAEAYAITSVFDEKLHSSGDDAERATIYELQLWKAGTTDDCKALARKWRRVNGSGTAKIIVHETSSGKESTPKLESCWYHHNTCLQHGVAPLKNPRTAVGIEIFTEQEYENAVFVDELMAEEWD